MLRKFSMNYIFSSTIILADCGNRNGCESQISHINLIQKKISKIGTHNWTNEIIKRQKSYWCNL